MLKASRLPARLQTECVANTISHMTVSRILWLALFAGLLALAILQGIAHGWGATAILVAFAIFPDLSLIGAFTGEGLLRPTRVPLYNMLHSPWMPLLLAVASGAAELLAFPGWASDALFVAANGWYLHIAFDRAAGYRPRLRDGSIGPAGRAAYAPCAV